MLDVQKKIGASTPYICGGTPRDRYLGRLDNIADIDITTGDKTVDYLSQEFYNLLSKKYNVKKTTSTDGHSTVFLGSFKMDFSSNFNVPEIEQYLLKLDIKDPTDMQKEMFSRDFTCNALLLSFDLKNLIDPTSRGFKDIKDRVIRTCLDPQVTLTTNKNRVVRAIYLAAKLDFDVDPAIINYVKKNPQTAGISTNKVMTEKLEEAFKRDADKASYLITQMGLWHEIPIPDLVYPYYEKYIKKNIAEKKAAADDNADHMLPPKEHGTKVYDWKNSLYQNLKKYKSVKQYRKQHDKKYHADDNDGRNYDLGKGLYENMDKYKSVEDFRDDHDINHLDFPIDDQVTPILGDSESFETPIKLGPAAGDMPNDGISPGSVGLGDSESYPASAQIGGYLDKYLSQPDMDDKPESTLDFGYDLTDSSPLGRGYEDDQSDKLNELEKKYNPAPPHGLYGLPDGTDLPDEDLGDPTDLNPDYGTRGPESLMYEDKWNI
jgi:tRNA nucleotidyltransferase/poly(A) polymerase